MGMGEEMIRWKGEAAERIKAKLKRQGVIIPAGKARGRAQQSAGPEKTSVQKAVDKAKRAANSEKLTKAFLKVWHFLKGPELAREVRFAPPRRWRLDFAYESPAIKLGIELQGAVWTGGGHTRGMGYNNDAEKLNTSQVLGWRLFHLSVNMMTINNVQPIIDLIRAAESQAVKQESESVPTGKIFKGGSHGR